jgi:hypothetical protein
MNFFEREYEQYRVIPSDINENLHYLHELALKCDHITEFGVRDAISTRAFLNTNATLISYDFKHFESVVDLFQKAKEYGKKVDYIVADVRTIEIEETDLLFIDTWHVYQQLIVELTKHGNKSRKYIIMHDTTKFGEMGECGEGDGLMRAINEFLNDNNHWYVHEKFENNNGLTILKRKNETN